MTDSQLYLALGLPSFVALVGILVNVGYFVAINTRIGAFEQRIDGRITALEQKFDTRFDLLMGKVFEIDNRLTRVEEQLKH